MKLNKDYLLEQNDKNKNLSEEFKEIQGNIDFTQEFLDRVESRMRDMVEMDMPIRKKSVHTDDARCRPFQ